MKARLKKIIEELLNWLDLVFLIPGMFFIAFGIFKIYVPAGYISLGICFIAFAFFIAKKYSVINSKSRR